MAFAFYDFLIHPVIAACFLAWLIAQLCKAIIAFLRDKKWSPAHLVADGGMPSSHVALVSALTTSILLLWGVGAAFIISLVFSLIVVRDALGVRRAVGNHAKLLELRYKRVLGLNEGHDIAEVIAGALVGIFVSSIAITNNLTLLYLLQVSYIMLPGILATMVPVIIGAYMKSMGIPLDLNLKIGATRVFGDNKTVFGFIAGVLTAIVVTDIQGRLVEIMPFSILTTIPYFRYNPLIVGLVIGIGVMGGDAIKSFIKRRLGISPGVSFFPWDQLDGAIGALILGFLFYNIGIMLIVSVLFLAIVYHLVISSLGIFFGIKKSL